MSRRLALVLLLATGCYVAPAPTTSNIKCTDLDGDTYCADIDCNDEDPAAYPGAQDPAKDNIDQNCDGYY